MIDITVKGMSKIPTPIALMMSNKNI